MKPFQPKPIACKVCGETFTARTTLHRVCSVRCSVRLKKVEKAEERAKVRTVREEGKRLGTLIAEAQAAFNAYIRARDAGLPCICCGKPFEPMKPGGSVDAGHFRARSVAPHLRFHEDNVFAQRKNCNRPGGTTYAAFRAGVVARIGEERVVALETNNAIHKWTKDEVREIRAKYRAKLRELNATPVGHP